MANQDNHPAPHFSIDGIMARFAARVEQVRAFAGVAIPELEDEPIKGAVYTQFRFDNKLEMLSNFGDGEIRDISESLLPFVAASAKRGPKPKSSSTDALLCYLAWAKSGCDFALLAKTLGMKESRFEDNVHRIRPILNAALKDRWWSNRSRPVPVWDSGAAPYAALLIDHHTTEVFRPKTRFSEAKIYWDGKNHCYGLKSEVAVSASAPHYCQFVQRYTVASVHDYADLKSHYTSYLEYLLKTPEEAALFPADVQNRYWAAILDKAYIGPAADTPDFRRVTPQKAPRTPQEAQRNVQISRDRVPIECFFGRVCSLWQNVGSLYRWDHSNFDMDFENACLLTNEHIKAHNLAELDQEFFFNLLSLRYAEQMEKIEKRKATLTKSKNVKKAKLRNAVVAVLGQL